MELVVSAVAFSKSAFRVLPFRTRTFELVAISEEVVIELVMKSPPCAVEK
jgi:hypothetical protein